MISFPPPLYAIILMSFWPWLIKLTHRVKISSEFYWLTGSCVSPVACNLFDIRGIDECGVAARADREIAVQIAGDCVTRSPERGGAGPGSRSRRLSVRQLSEGRTHCRAAPDRVIYTSLAKGLNLIQPTFIFWQFIRIVKMRNLWIWSVFSDTNVFVLLKVIGLFK